MNEKNQKTTEKIKKTFQIKPKLAVMLDKLNPYKTTILPDENNPGTPKKTILYRKLITWLIDVIINGAIFAFITWSFLTQKSYSEVNLLAIFTWGLAIFLVGKLLSIFWNQVVQGLKDIANELRFVK